MHKIEQLPNGTVVWVNKEHRFGSDALLLSAFTTVKPSWSVCDLCSGCGIILLSLLDKGVQGRAVGVELNPDACNLLAGAAKENNLPTVSAIQQDLCTYRTEQPFDLVVCNPPYFTNGLVPASQCRAQARHQISCSILDVCSTASKILKYGGKFNVCYPASSLTTLFASLQACKLEPKRMQFVRKTPANQPWLVMVEARLGGKPGLTIMPDCIISSGNPIHY